MEGPFKVCKHDDDDSDETMNIGISGVIVIASQEKIATNMRNTKKTRNMRKNTNVNETTKTRMTRRIPGRITRRSS